MPDYKQMYLTLLDATEKAISQLVSAQRACEELYVLSCEADEKQSIGDKAEILKMPEKKP
ncbi:MAG: hypothetical protein UIG59_00425 [Acutalibacteraceae bacterium]|nr:hypothetical protein [Acutalibacteraceae bacterium]